MKKNYVHIILVLDRSYSFLKVKDAVIRGVNTFLADQDLDGQETTLTLVLFDNSVDYLTEFQPIEDVPTLSSKTYVPRNQTSLLDAIGSAVLHVNVGFDGMEEKDQPEMIIMAVVTDGLDTSSASFPVKALKSSIDEIIAKEGWEFVLLCADKNAKKMGEKIGMLPESVLSFELNEPSVLESFNHLSKSVLDYRNVKTESVRFLAAEGQ